MEDSLLSLYLKVLHHIELDEIETWTKLDVTLSQLKVLMILSHNKEMAIGELAKVLKVSLPNMTGILNRLEQQGFLLRYKSDKDCRIVLIKLSDKAEERLVELKQAKKDSFKKIEDRLSDTEKEMVKLGFRVFTGAL